jgi:hypothetical protein
MERPKTFAGKVAMKYGKTTINDYPQPQKWFMDLKDCYTLLDGVPYSAIESLQKYDENRDIIVRTIQKLISICEASKIDVIKELDRLDEDPFDGLEADLAIKKKVIVSENN